MWKEFQSLSRVQNWGWQRKLLNYFPDGHLEHEEDVSPVNAEVITIRTDVLDDDDDDETPSVGSDIGCTSVICSCQ